MIVTVLKRSRNALVRNNSACTAATAIAAATVNHVVAVVVAAVVAIAVVVTVVVVVVAAAVDGQSNPGISESSKFRCISVTAYIELQNYRNDDQM